MTIEKQFLFLMKLTLIFFLVPGTRGRDNRNDQQYYLYPIDT